MSLLHPTVIDRLRIVLSFDEAQELLSMACEDSDLLISRLDLLCDQLRSAEDRRNREEEEEEEGVRSTHMSTYLADLLIDACDPEPTGCGHVIPLWDEEEV